ncbi:Fe-S-containing protein [Methanolobus sediminis]|uniref:Fe-S-containing protein n=1 Tax=Methanolobus sediminis TaxID=3072978 RepID=A0AA51ULC3_9EURY|nr:Fe-S-containing protein [Methanolobus sediminis]WMW25702.1 Fe-S-containing protein [Methanolobus sediminis]
MNGKLVFTFLLVLLVSLSALGCIGNGNSASSGSSGPVKGTWIESQISGDTVSIPVSSVDKYTNVHFKVNTDIGEVAVMTYKLGGDIFVRSNVCPPCRSIGFTLNDDVLVCDSCGTVFDAATGAGIQGGCVAYPKESISYTVSGDNIVMDLDDVVTAHQKTVEAY